MTISGTSHFVSFHAACSYYADYNYDEHEVDVKIDRGEIHIGKPELKEGQTLTLLDGGRRYAIQSN